jgi:DnaJ-class molecular chaperone
MPARICPKCKHDIRCIPCDGVGMLREKIMGVVVNERKCPDCKATGKQRYHRCPKVGSGQTSRASASQSANIQGGVKGGVHFHQHQ